MTKHVHRFAVVPETVRAEFPLKRNAPPGMVVRIMAQKGRCVASARCKAKVIWNHLTGRWMEEDRG